MQSVSLQNDPSEPCGIKLGYKNKILNILAVLDMAILLWNIHSNIKVYALIERNIDVMMLNY